MLSLPHILKHDAVINDEANGHQFLLVNIVYLRNINSSFIIGNWGRWTESRTNDWQD